MHMPPARPRTRTGPALAALAATLALGLAGCSGSGGDDAPAPTDSPAVESSTPAPTLPAGVTPAAIPTNVPNEPADRQNVVLSGCDKADGGWQAGGTATNPGKEKATYQVTVFFTTSSATTLNSASTKVEVDPGKTERWTVKKSFTTPPEVLCVLRGVAKL